MTVISFMAMHGTFELALRTVPVVSDAKGPVGLLVELDRRSRQQLHEQLEHRIRDAIRDGRLAAGTRLPSSRGLAAELGISRGVVTAVYDQLAAEGYLETRQGAPVRVAPGVRAHLPRPPAPLLEPKLAYDFTPGLPDLAGFPRDRWLRSLRAAWRETPLDAVGYGDPRGAAELPPLARRLPRAGPRDGGRPRAHDRLHRLSPGAVAHLSLAARPTASIAWRSRNRAGTLNG